MEGWTKLIINTVGVLSIGVLCFAYTVVSILDFFIFTPSKDKKDKEASKEKEKNKQKVRDNIDLAKINLDKLTKKNLDTMDDRQLQALIRQTERILEEIRK